MSTGAKQLLRRCNALVAPVLDIRKALSASQGYCRFIQSWWRYARLLDAEPLRLADVYPCLFDWTSSTEFDHHYVYLNAWAFRKIRAASPAVHVDVGSQVSFVTTLSAVLPVIFIDRRPLQVAVTGLNCREGTILSMPFGNKEVQSLSSLHVIEHVGLGR